MNATPFQSTIGGSTKNRCKWCKKAMEYIKMFHEPNLLHCKFWFCPVCDNVPEELR